MTVTPVAKHPRAWRNSAGETLMRTRKSLSTYITHPTNFENKRLPPGAAFPICLMYHLSILVSWQVHNLTVKEGIGLGRNSLMFLDELRHGLPLAREGACQLLRCSDDLLPALLVAARA